MNALAGDLLRTDDEDLCPRTVATEIPHLDPVERHAGHVDTEPGVAVPDPRLERGVAPQDRGVPQRVGSGGVGAEDVAAPLNDRSCAIEQHISIIVEAICALQVE